MFMEVPVKNKPCLRAKIPGLLHQDIANTSFEKVEVLMAKIICQQRHLRKVSDLIDSILSQWILNFCSILRAERDLILKRSIISPQKGVCLTLPLLLRGRGGGRGSFLQHGLINRLALCTLHSVQDPSNRIRRTFVGVQS